MASTWRGSTGRLANTRPSATLALVISGGPCALLAACALRNGASADVLVVEAPQRAGVASVHLLPTRALALLPPAAAGALRAHGSATPDGGTLCVDGATLCATLRRCLPPSSLVIDGRVTGFAQQAGEMHVRLEGRAGRRSQRSVACAVLLGTGGASCAVRAALLGVAPLNKRVALWRGTCAAQPGDGSPAGMLELARDADGACVGAFVKHGQRVYWNLLAPPLPPRAPPPDGNAITALALAAARWPSLAAVVAQTRAQHASCELIPESQRPLRGQNGVLLLGYAARGVSSAAMDELGATTNDVLTLMQALKYTPDVLATAANAYATAAFHG